MENSYLTPERAAFYQTVLHHILGVARHARTVSADGMPWRTSYLLEKLLEIEKEVSLAVEE